MAGKNKEEQDRSKRIEAERQKLMELFNRACESGSPQDYVKIHEALLDMEVPRSPFIDQMRANSRQYIERFKERAQVVSSRIIRCPDCEGTGTVQVTLDAHSTKTEKCLTCDGKGKVKATIEKLK